MIAQRRIGREAGVFTRTSTRRRTFTDIDLEESRGSCYMVALDATTMASSRRRHTSCGEVEAKKRILAAITLESGNIDSRKYARLVDLFTEERPKDESTPKSPTCAAESMMGTIFDIKDKITDNEYMVLTNLCNILYSGESSIRLGRDRNGLERKIERSTLEDLDEFISSINAAKALHRIIHRMVCEIKRISEKYCGEDDHVSKQEISRIEAHKDVLQVRHREMIINAQHCLASVQRRCGDDKTLLKFVLNGSYGIRYLTTVTVPNKRKRVD